MKKNVFIFLILLLYPVFIFATDKVEINTASLEQLETLTGIGKVKAQTIIDDRPFLSIDDLIKVSGIGEQTLQKIKEQGLAYVSDQTPRAPATAKNITTGDDAIVSKTPASEPIGAINEQIKGKTYPTGIIINEILPSPEGPDEENEWIEIYNSNTFEVDLSGWKISDSMGSITNYFFSENKKIIANGFLVFKRPKTKITLNNDQDQLTLYSPDDAVKDTMSYNSAPNGQSYNRTASGWHWSASLSPGANNILTVAKTPSAGSGSGDLSKTQKNDTNTTEDNLLADVSLLQQTGLALNQKSIKTQNPWFLFFTALTITIILSISVLFIKLKLNNKCDANMRMHTNDANE